MKRELKRATAVLVGGGGRNQRDDEYEPGLELLFGAFDKLERCRSRRAFPSSRWWPGAWRYARYAAILDSMRRHPGLTHEEADQNLCEQG